MSVDPATLATTGRILITAGPTREYLDDVRYLSNRSSGRMGIALAEAWASRLPATAAPGSIQLVAGPVEVPLPSDPRIESTRVTSAAEMFAAATSRFPNCHLFVAAAAVADFTPAERIAGKRKKTGPPTDRSDEVEPPSDEWMLRLVPTQDILASLSHQKRPDQTVVGFALEVQNAAVHAREKLIRKRCDWIVRNSPRNFGDASDTLYLLSRDGHEITVTAPTKQSAAHHLVQHLIKTPLSTGRAT